MTDTSLMIAAARRCLGTPFHHQGRAPGVGLDCIGLVIVALRATGFAVQDRADYSRRPDGESLIAAIEAHGGVLTDKITEGCILVFRFDHQPQHVALATSDSAMIHSFAPAKRVVETAIGDVWKRRLVAIYSLPAPSSESKV